MSTPAQPHSIAPPPESELKALQQALFDFISQHGYQNANASGFVNQTTKQVTLTVGASMGPEASYTITVTWDGLAEPAKA
jgi:hypothetical protein